MSEIPLQQQTQKASDEADPIDENIQTVAELHKHAENKVSTQQRTIEDMTDFLGRPRFLFIILVFVSLKHSISCLRKKNQDRLLTQHIQNLTAEVTSQ